MSRKTYTSYDEWAADHMENGKIKDGVSYADQRIGDYLLNQKNQYDAYDGKMKEQRDKAISDADILNRRMQKYLPQQLAAQGLHGTGISEDAYLKLQKQYNDSVASANKIYSQGLSDYKLTMDGQSFDKVDSIRKESEKEMAAEYDKAAAVIEAGFDTAKEYVDYIESVRDRVSEEDCELLMNAAIASAKKNNASAIGLPKGNRMANALTESKLNTVAATEHGNLGDGDDIKVTVGTSKLTVESAGEALSDAPAAYAAENGITDGTFFIYGEGDTVYYYIGGKAYKVVSKSNSDFNRAQYNDLRHYLQYGTYGDNVDKQKKSTYDAKSSSSWGRK